jgi:hypothetical protein
MKSDQDTTTDGPPSAHRRDAVIAALLIGCAAVVGFWQIMAHRSRQAFNRFELSAEDFGDFAPASRPWFIARLPIPPDPLEPNIQAYSFRRRYPVTPAESRAVMVRLVHGYNMRDCMRIKGFRVDLVEDFREGGLPVERRTWNAPAAGPAPIGRVQVWRVASDIGDAEIWITSMLHAWDFSESDMDTRSMAFPRVNVPDSQGWSPQGLTLRSLKRPIHNLRVFLRSRWNASRNDLATFLRLKQPAWASEDILTLVTTAQGRLSREEDEAAVVAHALDAHLDLYMQLARWRLARTEQPAATGRDTP